MQHTFYYYIYYTLHLFRYTIPLLYTLCITQTIHYIHKLKKHLELNGNNFTYYALYIHNYILYDICIRLMPVFGMCSVYIYKKMLIYVF